MSELKPNWVGAETILNQLMEIARIAALAEMASGMAHELNQPLGAIATFSQAGERMLNRADPMLDRAIDVFRQINAQALGAGDGIRRIRRLFDREERQRTPCRMPQVIAELLPLLELVAQRANGTLKVDAAPQVPEVTIDRLRIQHVLFALVQNAFDAGAANPQNLPVEIDVRADRYMVETGVTDGGSGVGAEVGDQLFRPFFTTKPQGTGLGLACSRAIIEAHEGCIGFENLASGGTRFWFRLPIVER